MEWQFVIMTLGHHEIKPHQADSDRHWFRPYGFNPRPGGQPACDLAKQTGPRTTRYYSIQ